MYLADGDSILGNLPCSFVTIGQVSFTTFSHFRKNITKNCLHFRMKHGIIIVRGEILSEEAWFDEKGISDRRLRRNR